MQVVNVFDACDKIFPLYFKYDSQCNPQPAYISLNLESGEINADCSGEIGNAVSFDVWNNIELHWKVSPELSVDQINDLIESNTSYFQKILDSSDIFWNGNNWVGRTSTDIDGREFEGVEPYGGLIDNFAEWIYDSKFPKETQSVEDFIKEIYMLDGDNGFYFNVRESLLTDVTEMVIDFWAELLYSGIELPKKVAQYLLDSGKCNDSAWLDELTEFANAND